MKATAGSNAVNHSFRRYIWRVQKLSARRSIYHALAVPKSIGRFCRLRPEVVQVAPPQSPQLQ